MKFCITCITSHQGINSATYCSCQCHWNYATSNTTNETSKQGLNAMSKEEILKELLVSLKYGIDREGGVDETAWRNQLSSALDRYALSVVEETIYEHNARILNEYQLHQLGDERILFAPITKATKETLENAKRLTQ